MRILHVLSDGRLGGGPRHVRDLMTGVSRHQHTVAMPSGPAWQWFPDTHGYRWAPGAKAISDLAGVFRQSRPDLVHTHGRVAGLFARPLAWLARKPTVHTYHGLPYDRHGRTAKRLWLAVDRALGARTDRLIHVSCSQAIEAERLGLWTDRSRIIHNGVDPAQIRAQAGLRAPRMRRRPGVKALVTVGAKNPVKNLHDVLEAVDALGLAGAKLDLFVLEGADILPEMAGGDLYVSASSGEGLPYSILEAMALGLPIVASAVRGHVDCVLHGKTGFLTLPGDPRDMAQAISRLLNDAALAHEMGLAGQARVTEFSLDRMLRRTEHVYREAA